MLQHLQLDPQGLQRLADARGVHDPAQGAKQRKHRSGEIQVGEAHEFLQLGLGEGVGRLHRRRRVAGFEIGHDCPRFGQRAVTEVEDRNLADRILALEFGRAHASRRRHDLDRQLLVMDLDAAARGVGREGGAEELHGDLRSGSDECRGRR
jgi:hypothetical protein